MSSKRGRKRNDNLPPNRARDVQRAFRARRAAHLQALEERVSELETENDYLRQALSLPPSSRPPLGRGPTGKDRPRTFDTSSLQSLSPHPSRESSVDLSPTSRPSSQSPSSIAASMTSRPVAVMQASAWNESMLLDDQSHQSQHSHQHSDLAEPSSSPYHLSPMTAPVSTKQYLSYVNSIASSSRQLPNDIYLSSPNTYAQSPDRPIGGNYGGHNFPPRGEIRDEIRQQYVYTHPYQHDPNMRSQSPSPITQSNPHINSLQRDPTIPFPPRRSSLDPQGYSIGEGFPRLPNPVQLQHNPRPPDSRQPDHLHVPAVSRPAHYGQDGRLNSNPVP
ncbi:hypothetical protein BYT27DRAFT_7146346 [Phlegmacium glaucopus]|nr:hypothetical protein BYT27DRAFT_7146346 [Phlegmacium glaucopus]